MLLLECISEEKTVLFYSFFILFFIYLHFLFSFDLSHIKYGKQKTKHFFGTLYVKANEVCFHTFQLQL